MLCMCIDRGCVGTGENVGAERRCAVGQLFVRNRTGYMGLCCVCVLTEGALVQGRMEERSEDMLLDRFSLEQDRIYGVIFCMCLVEGAFG